MSELIELWASDELEFVGNELERLFLLQDRPLPKEKKMLFIDELSRSGLKPDAIVAGMRALMTDDDVTKLKLTTILSAARKKVDPAGIYEVIPCEECDKRGLVTMLDAEKYSFALACRCKNGQQWVDRGHQRWWGGKSQVSSRKNIMTGETVTRTLYLREW